MERKGLFGADTEALDLECLFKNDAGHVVLVGEMELCEECMRRDVAIANPGIVFVLLLLPNAYLVPAYSHHPQHRQT